MNKPFNREKFLLWMLTGLLSWQCALFTYVNSDVRQRRQAQNGAGSLPKLG